MHARVRRDLLPVWYTCARTCSDTALACLQRLPAARHSVSFMSICCPLCCVLSSPRLRCCPYLVQLHWLDASEKRYKDMGIGCVRVISRTRTQEDGTTAKVARFVFALPAPAGKGRDKILVNAALYKGLRFSASGGGDGPPPALTLDMYINKSVGDANTSKLERYMVKVKSSAQQDAIVAAMAPYV